MTDFLIKSSVSMAVLLTVYYIFIEREKMHVFKRFYLLFSLAFSLALPFITIPVYIAVPPQTSVTNTVINNYTEAATVSGKEITMPLPEVNYWPYILWGAYIIITIMLCIRLIINLTRFYKLKKHNENVDYNGIAIVLLDTEVLPHTFMNTIYMSKKEYTKNSIEPELYTHEMVHIRQYHTWDILFIEVIKALMWFNPLVYLYKQAIQLNHEFLADEATITQHINIPIYQQLLLDKAACTATYTLASSINFGITKKRFTMMTKTTSKTKSAILKLGTAPIVVILIMLLSVKTIAQEIDAPDIDANKIKSIEVTSVSDNEMKALLEENEIAFTDAKAEDYKRIKYTYQDDNGDTATKVSYHKNAPKKDTFKMMPIYPKIDHSNVAKIEMVKFTQTQMDSLRLSQPEWFSKDANSQYEGALYKYIDKNGIVTKKIGYEEVNKDIKSSADTDKAIEYLNEKNTSTITAVHQQPEYKDGYIGFLRYIEKNFKYENSGKIGVGLKLIYDFNVDEEGKISDIQIESSTVVSMTEEIKATIPDIEKQLKNLIKTSSGEWQPGKKDGKPVKAKISMPYYLIVNL